MASRYLISPYWQRRKMGNDYYHHWTYYRLRCGLMEVTAMYMSHHVQDILVRRK